MEELYRQIDAFLTISLINFIYTLKIYINSIKLVSKLSKPTNFDPDKQASKLKALSLLSLLISKSSSDYAGDGGGDSKEDLVTGVVNSQLSDLSNAAQLMGSANWQLGQNKSSHITHHATLNPR